MCHQFVRDRAVAMPLYLLTCKSSAYNVAGMKLLCILGEIICLLWHFALTALLDILR